MAGCAQIKREVTDLRNLFMICQERIVANNAVCASSPVALQLGWPESAELSGTWLALSELHYCRHNSCSVALCLPGALQIPGKPTACSRWFFIVMLKQHLDNLRRKDLLPRLKND